MTAAAATLAIVTLAGLAWATALVYRNRRPQQLALPAGNPPQTVWDATVAALGHPDTIDTTPPPCPPWPTWRSIPDRDYQTAIAALTNEH